MGRLLIVRHADRWDYANPDWASRARELNLNHRDPPLSPLGLAQAEELSKEIEAIVKDWGSIDALMVSPYLRVIQTAQPLARKLNLEMKIEEGLSETHHTPGKMPPSHERWAYFPEIDPTYESMYKFTLNIDEKGKEVYPEGYMHRMVDVAQVITDNFVNKNVICFTHAASTALVAALTHSEMPKDESMKFAPCGIYHLEKGDSESQDENGKWKLIRDGGSNTEYISSNSPYTTPWGFVGWKIDTWNDIVRERLLHRQSTKL